MQAAPAARPALAGVTVLDFATVGPAARCTRILADYGATVVKVGAPPKTARGERRTVEMSANDRRFLRSLRIAADETQEKEVE